MRKTSSRIRGVSRAIQERARELRKHMTPAEQLLWEHLRARRLRGLKFRRQHPLGRFIVDFCCPEHRLIIEVDGGIHADQKAYDQSRTDVLQSYGYQVLRFSNKRVLQHLDEVLEAVTAAVQDGD